MTGLADDFLTDVQCEEFYTEELTCNAALMEIAGDDTQPTKRSECGMRDSEDSGLLVDSAPF